MPIQADEPITRKADVFFTIVDDEVIIMDEVDEKFFSSKKVGAMIWQQLETPTTIHALTDAVAARYPTVPRDTIATDVSDFVGELDRIGLIIPSAAV